MKIRDERGHSTAEYGIGTLGAVVFASILAKFGGLHDPNDSWFGHFIRNIISQAFGGGADGPNSWIWRWLT